MEEEKGVVVQSLIDVVSEIASISEYRYAVKKQYCNLARRLKLLTPMFEEIRDSKEALPEDTVKALVSFKDALQSAKELLRFGSEGSKIYLVLEREQIMKKFQEVTNQLEQALSGISYEKLDISDEVKEQVELVLAQFRRAKGRMDAPDVELYEDLLSLYNSNDATVTDPAVLRRLVDKLQLMGIAELTQESLALHEIVASSGGDPGESIEKMSMLLKKIKDFMQTENPDMDAPTREKSLPASCSGHMFLDKNHKVPVIPDDFKLSDITGVDEGSSNCFNRTVCFSWFLRKNHTVGSSLDSRRDLIPSNKIAGFIFQLIMLFHFTLLQTYERSCIEKWLEAGHGTCPKTQQSLSSTALTPNYVLQSLIAQWCEANGIEPRSDRLTSGNPEDQRSAAGEIRLLAKRNADNRVAIAEAGAIPLLVGLLLAPDSRTQEHAVTALLNLSICDNNKGSIISSRAVPGIVHVLKKGSMEARENAAATLFSLSVVDENKVTIGNSGAIPPLVTLLSEGTQRGKKDAATALFNLCIYQGNKGKAVRAGIVPTLMQLLTEPGGGMVDEALAILAILASHSEGKAAIGAADAVPVLVEVIGTGSPRNRENAAAVLVHLCAGDQQHIVEAQELGVMGPLVELAQNGTDRGEGCAVA
ncbi:hypothetical protein FNV43_RR04429 [Rhamnella rubrinervis]|uniref:RING-type E3 ubiquitin transferase n=1 Tax=Rhamnella rubrinervis TaxID=2594499 RepID=A0A8K0HJR1_9ROSA|nr:hypothetical protein FNV43_RR04429 [Rhamnella rubrinervis]